MLDERDLQAIQSLIAANNEVILKQTKEMISEAETRITKQTETMVKEAETRIAKSTVALMDLEFTPKFDLLAEAIQNVEDKLTPRSRVDDLEDEVKFMKAMMRQMAERISDLEKAN